jgi:RNA polymerase sigma-70 factor (ECF subfamily)
VTDLLQPRSTGVIETPASPVAAERAETTSERLEALYRSSRDDVYAYVATLLRDRSAAEDVTALTFERAFRRRRSFDRRRGEERAWLFGIARNAALDELRRRRRTTRWVAEPVAAHEEHAAEHDDDALVRTTVRTALSRLPAREREVIGLKFHAGMSNAEIARVLGVTESNAGTLLYRAMQKLRKACDETT